MRITPMPFYRTKGMFYYRLTSFVILWIRFDVVIINVHRILVLTAMNDAFGKLGALMF